MRTSSRRPMVYILECADQTLYTGATKNLDQRLQMHSLGRGSKYVASRQPFKLVYTEFCTSWSEALRREIQIKRLPRSKKLERIAAG